MGSRRLAAGINGQAADPMASEPSWRSLSTPGWSHAACMLGSSRMVLTEVMHPAYRLLRPVLRAGREVKRARRARRGTKMERSS